MRKREHNIQKRWLLTLSLLGILIFSGTLPLHGQSIPAPAPRDTCPVCGMFVAHYPDWTATVLYHDRLSHHFDGAKDCFTYLLDMKKWAQGREEKDIQSISVKEYYGLKQIDGRTAYYVSGSNVLGPMGHELIPFATLEDAETFMRDHQGKKIHRFNDIDKDLLSRLNKGIFQ